MALNEERIEVELISKTWREEDGILIPVREESSFNRLTDVHRTVYAQAMTGNISNIPNTIKIGVGAKLSQAIDVSDGPVSLIVLDTVNEIRQGSSLIIGEITNFETVTVQLIQGNTITVTPPVTSTFPTGTPVVLTSSSVGSDLQNSIFSKAITTRSVVSTYYASYFTSLSATEGLVGGNRTVYREVGMFNSSGQMLSRVVETVAKNPGDIISLEFRSRILP